MNEQDRIHREVSEAYTKAVGRQASCCGPGGVTARLAGYGADAPAEAAQDSFGCGNPVALSGVREGDVVLDLGSGAGLDLLLAAEKVGPRGRVIGVDMTDAMIERARAHVARAGAANVEVRKGLIEELPVESASVDWVISNCVVNLSPDKPRVFAEIARVLRPGGRMLISDMVAEGLPAWVRKSAALYASCVGGAISEPEYLDGLRRAGLVDVEVRKRLVYDAAQLAELARTELSGGGIAACCAGAVVPLAARAVAGKVASIAVAARKPAAAG